uniref:Myosin motor domain-containing protein n=1 Tax=Aegilops tauschii subsp. strangulata TaxID=200361 RepID=A0A453RF00_AEGTS
MTAHSCRVVRRAPEERSYHISYQLFSGSSPLHIRFLLEN